MITLPGYLPQCSLRTDWTLSPINPNRRTEMDDGETAVSRRFSRIGGTMGMGWELDGAQFAVAQDFWARDLNGGASWFLAPVFLGLEPVIAQCRFSSDPPWTASSPKNGVIKMTFELDIRELTVLSPAQRMALNIWLDAREDIDGVTAALKRISTALEDLPQWP